MEVLSVISLAIFPLVRGAGGLLGLHSVEAWTSVKSVWI